MKKRKTYNQPKTVVGKTPQQKRNQIYAYILAFAMVFWTIASVLGIIGFVRGFGEDTPSASAQSYAVNGIKKSTVRSNYFFTIDLEFGGATVADGWDNTTPCFALDTLELIVGVDLVSIHTGYSTIDLEYDEEDDVYNTPNGVDYQYGRYTVTEQGDIQLSTNVGALYAEYDSNTIVPSYPQSLGGCVPDTVDVFLSFINDRLIYRFEIHWVTLQGSDLGSSFLSVSFDDGLYYDSLVYQFVYPGLGFIYNTDLQRLDLSLGSLYGFDYESVRDMYYVGFDDGYVDGESDGFDDGYTNGYNVGVQDGYIQGVAEANEYSFNTLFASIFDVPVQTFTNLFNFEVLGVNLSGFFFAILTIGIILAVVKWLLP